MTTSIALLHVSPTYDEYFHVMSTNNLLQYHEVEMMKPAVSATNNHRVLNDGQCSTYRLPYVVLRRPESRGQHFC